MALRAGDARAVVAGFVVSSVFAARCLSQQNAGSSSSKTAAAAVRLRFRALYILYQKGDEKKIVRCYQGLDLNGLPKCRSKIASFV
jgi:hypothetical protein